MTDQETKPGPVWAYAYEFMQPQPEDRMRAVRRLLDREEREARKGTRSWGSRFLTRQQVTHILIVSDSPHQDLDGNHRLEAELGKLKAEFFVTAAVAVGDEDHEPTPPPTGASENPPG